MLENNNTLREQWTDLTPPNRETMTFTKSAHPEDARRRKWGYTRDWIWFYSKLVVHPGDLDYVADAEDGSPIYTDGKGLWRTHYEQGPGGDWTGRWLRLYMERRILWLGAGRTFRLHTFYAGDPQVPHDHPWWFVTFPLATYRETVEEVVSWEYAHGTAVASYERREQDVRRFRFYYRPALHRHFVHEAERVFSTIVITGGIKRKWGFWPLPHHFVPFDIWAKRRDGQ